MSEISFHRDNHYVPCAYLKRWASPKGHVWTYRTLVSHLKVPFWKESSPKGVAYHSHLYTRLIAGQETDDIERWLDREFESPAEEALRKATSDDRLTTADWKCLIRFLAAQDVRTPARLAESLRRWNREMPEFLDKTLNKSVRRLEEARNSGKAILPSEAPANAQSPFRITTEELPDEDFVNLKVEVVAGRGLWLFIMRHLLEKTSRVLLQHKWTILVPPKGLCWFTSDDPVVRLNFYKNYSYDFGGGWNNVGSEIFLPLGPYHLLYTQVGKKPPRRGEIVMRDHAEYIRRFVAEHAHRMIFAADQDVDIPKLRPRVVDAELLRKENEHWQRWHKEQTAAELRLMGTGKE
ncbi:MAG: DUF4238 domain-containing protein [Thermoanaerobaculia bacterium]